jgi:hypothetical protein
MMELIQQDQVLWQEDTEIMNLGKDPLLFGPPYLTFLLIWRDKEVSFEGNQLIDAYYPNHLNALFVSKILDGVDVTKHKTTFT